MKKRVLALGVVALCGMTLTSTACKNGKKNNEDQMEQSSKGMDESPDQPQSDMGSDEMNANESDQKSMSSGKNKDADMDKAAEEAQEKIDEAVKKIEKSGDDFVKSIKNGEDKQAMTKAQDKFMNAVQEAQATYKKVSASEAEIDFNKAQKRIQDASNKAQQKAQQAMQQR